ncbi:MAG TPA: cell division protein FtsA [Verrucomicrobia bacterium]|nr:MAG: cell division protein FtsA [Lentisphaerae bacterium GWF2_57_35]HBA84218.1 cell division protein FtsA [Verrucomicrobiota bacterium]
MNLPPIVALEIGTSRIRAIVGEAREDGCIMVTGLGECDSRGVRKGEIVDFDNALACVRTALHMAEESGRVIINEVHLAMSGGHIKSLVNRGSVPILDPDGEITSEDIAHVMETARAVSLPQDREILHTICQRFYVDDQQGVINPEGMEGSKLALDMLILHGVRNRLRNMVRVVRSVQVDVADVAFSGLCSALAVLSPEDKESGVAVIDLGGGTTDYVVYAHNAIAAAGSLAVGGDHITSDIARGLRIPPAEAERIKLDSGSAIVDLTTRAQKIGLTSEMGTPDRSAKLSDLNTIIHLRMEETFSLLKAQWMEDHLLHSIGGGIVLTGGGAFLKNVERLAEKVFGLPCRLGHPRNVSGLAVATEGPEFAAVVGMVRYGFKTAGKEAPSRSLTGWLSKLFGK